MAQKIEIECQRSGKEEEEGEAKEERRVVEEETTDKIEILNGALSAEASLAVCLLFRQGREAGSGFPALLIRTFPSFTDIAKKIKEEESQNEEAQPARTFYT